MVSSLEPGDGKAQLKLKVVGLKFLRVSQISNGEIELPFRDRKIGKLAQAESDGFVILTLRLNKIVCRERRLGGIRLALQDLSRIVGSPKKRCAQKKYDDSGESNRRALRCGALSFA